MNSLNKHWKTFALFGGTLLFFAYQNGWVARALGNSPNPQELVELIAKDPNTQVVDVRESDEIASGILKTARWIPKSGINGNDPKVIELLNRLDRKRPVYIYCRSGSRAGKVAARLNGDGYQAHNVGGFDPLKAAGAEVTLPKTTQ